MSDPASMFQIPHFDPHQFQTPVTDPRHLPAPPNLQLRPPTFGQVPNRPPLTAAEILRTRPQVTPPARGSMTMRPEDLFRGQYDHGGESTEREPGEPVIPIPCPPGFSQCTVAPYIPGVTEPETPTTAGGRPIVPEDPPEVEAEHPEPATEPHE
jgi:hypothetical protein